MCTLRLFCSYSLVSSQNLKVLRNANQKRCGQKKPVDDARGQAVILWNSGLYFEVHDILKDIRHKTKGDERQALKGLIRAAGDCVHLENHGNESAKRLADKSTGLIRKYSRLPGFIANFDELIDALKVCNPVPPKLKYAAFESERNNND